MKYLFVHFCNIISKDGIRKTRDSVWFEALLFLSLGAVCWFLLIVALYYFYVRNENLPTLPGSIALLGSPFIVFYYFLIRGKKHGAVLDEFRNETPRQNIVGKIIAALYLFIPIITGMIVSLVWQNKF